MAYNRIYLKCRICGEEFMLAKSYGNGFFRPDYKGGHGVELLAEFNEFLDQHTFCRHEGGEGDYVLEYEIPPFGEETV